MKAIALTFFLIFPTFALAKTKVVTTLPSFADIARIVGGEDAEATSLTRGNQDPHFVDPKPDLILRLNRADLLVYAGLGLEDGWLPPLVTGSRNGKIQPGTPGNLDTSTLVELKDIPSSVDRSQGDVHPGGNPHFMLDPRNGIVVARGLAVRLGQLDPAKAQAFRARAEAYAKELTAKIGSWEKALAPLKGRAVVTYHRSWPYFLAWSGLRPEGYIEPKPGIPPAPDHIAGLVRTMKEKKVTLVLVEPYYPRGTAEEVARLAGAKLHVLPTEVEGTEAARGYSAVFDTIVAALTTPKASP